MFTHLDLWSLGLLRIQQSGELRSRCSCRGSSVTVPLTEVPFSVDAPPLQEQLLPGTNFWGLNLALGKKWTAYSNDHSLAGYCRCQVDQDFLSTAHWETSSFTGTKCSPTLLTCCLCLFLSSLGLTCGWRWAVHWVPWFHGFPPVLCSFPAVMSVYGDSKGCRSYPPVQEPPCISAKHQHLI